MTAAIVRRRERHEARAGRCVREVRVAWFWRSLAQSGGGWRLSKLPARCDRTDSRSRSRSCSASCSRRPPAAAFDWRRGVVDFEFQPAERKISVGDSVTWNFGVDGHTTASVGGQPDSWKSADTGTNAAGTSSRTSSTRPGSYQYVCLQHRDFMKGVDRGGHRHRSSTRSRQLQDEAHRPPREGQLPAERAGHDHVQADRAVTPDREAAAASTPAAHSFTLQAAEARHLPRECSQWWTTSTRRSRRATSS